MSTTGRTSSASASASAFSTAVTSASSFSTTTTIPRQPTLSLAESQNYGHTDNHYGDGEHGTRNGSSNLIPDNSRLDPIAGGRGNGNPLSLQLQLQQILLQQTQQRQLAWLHLWQTDRAKALASDRLHDLDRQELGQWLVWKKREKARRLRELRRKRLELAARRRMQQHQGREEAQVDGQGMTSSGSSTQQHRPQEEEDMEGDLRGREIRNATSRTHSRTWSGSGPVRGGTDTINGGGGASRRRRARTTTNMLTSDEDDDDDDDDEGGSSDDSDSEDDVVGPMDFDSDDGVLLSDSSDYEASDDETPLMKLVSTFDALHAWISTSSASALSALQDAATFPVSVTNYNYNYNYNSDNLLDYHLVGPLHGFDVDKRPWGVEGGWQRYDLGMDYQLPYHSGPAVNGFKSSTSSRKCHTTSGRGFGTGETSIETGLCQRLDCQNDHGPLPRSLQIDPFRVPLRLESLDFAGCYQISDKGLTPLLKQCGSHLLQLRVSDCDNITSASVVALANHCPNTEWLDLCRTGALTEECLILLAERCTDLEWLNLARASPGVLESSLEDGLGGGGAEGDNTNNSGTGGGINSDINGEAEIEQDHDEEVIDVDNEKTPVPSDGNRLVKEETSTETENQHQDQEEEEEEEEEKVKEDSITDRALALLCESCPNLQLLDLSYISTISNTAMESLSETAKSLVCLTIIGCPGITSQSLLYLARLRNSSGKLGCITMGDALGISERDIEQIMQGMLSGWQKSLVDETNLGEILGRSWDE
ncbi:hypothetical protein KI688_003850 [Linnemannia hyalina]|uniref:RNI-like protein n=1 Tax=Linnemannia hyalina TaxID=64524 RepID=A0A9P7XNH9_9FUNG|nr:hypothetical protein KI688_003850 [Linnemannia hyalina]